MATSERELRGDPTDRQPMIVGSATKDRLFEFLPGALQTERRDRCPNKDFDARGQLSRRRTWGSTAEVSRSNQ